MRADPAGSACHRGRDLADVEAVTPFGLVVAARDERCAMDFWAAVALPGLLMFSSCAGPPTGSAAGQARGLVDGAQQAPVRSPDQLRSARHPTPLREQVVLEAVPRRSRERILSGGHTARGGGALCQASAGQSGRDALRARGSAADLAEPALGAAALRQFAAAAHRGGCRGGGVRRAHSAVQPGRSSPRDAAGRDLFEPVWRYMFTHPVDAVGQPVPIDVGSQESQRCGWTAASGAGRARQPLGLPQTYPPRSFVERPQKLVDLIPAQARELQDARDPGDEDRG